MKLFIIWNVILFIFTSYTYFSVSSGKNIEYAEGLKISLKEDSAGRRPIYFFGSLRQRSPSGGGFGYGK